MVDMRILLVGGTGIPSKRTLSCQRHHWPLPSHSSNTRPGSGPCSVTCAPSGTIGQAVHDELSRDNEVILAGRSAAVKVDLNSSDSIRSMFEAVGKVDAVISTAGQSTFAPLESLTPQSFNVGLQSKLLGQINLVLIGQEFVADGCCFILTGGFLARVPLKATSNLAAVNAGLSAFAKTAACETTRGMRINVVSPGLVTESVPKYGPFFPGFGSVPAARVALGYRRALFSGLTGTTFEIADVIANEHS